MKTIVTICITIAMVSALVLSGMYDSPILFFAFAVLAAMLISRLPLLSDEPSVKPISSEEAIQLDMEEGLL